MLGGNLGSLLYGDVSVMTMAIESFRILNSLAPPVLTNLHVLKNVEPFITVDIQIFYRFQRSEPVNLVRVLLGMLPLCCGTFFRKIVEIAQILTSFDSCFIMEWEMHFLQ